MPFALAFGDGLTCGPDVIRVLETARVPIPDRRKRVRVCLTWTVYFSRSTQTHPVHSQTRNISSEGLYCIVTKPFTVGEAIDYTLIVPAFNAERRYDLVRLEGQVEVVRFEPLGAGMYGVACRVRDYKVLPPGADHLHD